ncbi:hypothetical protein T440DRAFT_536565 [Plenodomus tracheiphilus IPT5]|uniref:Uncharacterized protein n=1 Tax=Plenodomus tracheiphilus IPT5 TaxID=1408161 RepID=A0A6A7B135_9PLEO|nr:hypothetical protein T440DRAFT_536565 [Plenodomus tracheiphilus IPT5]
MLRRGAGKELSWGTGVREQGQTLHDGTSSVTVDLAPSPKLQAGPPIPSASPSSTWQQAAPWAGVAGADAGNGREAVRSSCRTRPDAAPTSRASRVTSLCLEGACLDAHRDFPADPGRPTDDVTRRSWPPTTPTPAPTPLCPLDTPTCRRQPSMAWLVVPAIVVRAVPVPLQHPWPARAL